MTDRRISDPREATPSRRLQAICAADAAWDGLLGIALCLSPWAGFAERIGLPAGRPWPVFEVLGVGTLSFAALLARAAAGRDTITTARAAALGNSAGAGTGLVALGLLQPLSATGTLTLALAATGCALFAGLEYTTSPAAPLPAARS
jgi:hypothetical protein